MPKNSLYDPKIHSLICKKCRRKFMAVRRTQKFCNRKCMGKYNSSLPWNKSLSYRGGKFIDGEGYVQVMVPGWPTLQRNGYIREHRYKMEKKLGRSLQRNEHIHHKNGNKQDNRLCNLKLMSASDHAKHTRATSAQCLRDIKGRFISPRALHNNFHKTQSSLALK